MKTPRIVSTLLLVVLAALPGAAQEGTWTRIGPDGGYVRKIAAAPSRPSIVYAGLGLGGVFRSADRGRTWAFAGEGLIALLVHDLEVDPMNPDRVYAGTSQGLFQSVDGGRIWRRIGRAELTGPFGPNVLAVEIHPRQPALLLAAVYGGGLFRSTDRGRTWSTEPGWPERILSLTASPVRPGVFWAGLQTGGLFKSTDSGTTWTAVGHGLPNGIDILDIAVDPRAGDTLYAVASGALGVFRSTDGGDTWTPSGNGLGDALIRGVAVDAERPSTVYALTIERLFRSRDGGATWRALAGTGLRGIPQAVAPLGSGLLAGTGEGLFLSLDQGATWRPSQAGLTATGVSSLAVDGQDPMRIYAVDFLRGLFKTREGNPSWQLLRHADTGPVAVHPAAPETIYAGIPLHIAKSENGGRRWTAYSVGWCFVPTRIEVDPQDPATLYTSGTILSNRCSFNPVCILFRSRDAGQTWSCIGDGLPSSIGGPLLEIDSRTSALYVASGTGVWTSTDRGDTWSLLSPELHPSSFAASPVEEGTLWVGRVGRVGTSRDGGQTWTYSSAGLPRRGAVMHLAAHPTDPAVVYAGTYAHGVYRSTDGGLTWTPLGTWPAGLRLWAGIVLDPRDPSVVYAGTEGAGVLRFEP
jgi:photosystem II stability/assembly factor-like uncharacterized protein